MKIGEKTSAIPNFHKLSLEEKIKILKKFANLNEKEISFIKEYQKLPDFVDFENNLGPFKIATNFLINNKDYLVPMEIEEPSVVAAASRGAKLIRQGGGFWGRYLGNEILGQIQILKIKDFKKAQKEIYKNKQEILKLANETQKTLWELGGGAKDFFLKKIKNYLVFYLVLDPKDAQGANMMNTMLETISPILEKIAQGEVCSKIVSNYSPRRLVLVEGKVAIEKLKKGKFSGKKVAERILKFMDLARHDIFRATTNNKGIMNGIDAVLLATGNDFRAVEVAVHSFATKNGKYLPLSDWKIKGKFLQGKIVVPMPIATVGGATNTKKAILARKILGVKTAQELGIICAAVGLANNLAAISAIVSEGIQKGHLKLHQEFIKKIS